MLNLKLEYFGHLKRRADSLEKTLILGKIEGRRRSNKFNGIIVCVVLVVIVLSQPMEHLPQWRYSKPMDF